MKATVAQPAPVELTTHVDAVALLAPHNRELEFARYLGGIKVALQWYSIVFEKEVDKLKHSLLRLILGRVVNVQQLIHLEVLCHLERLSLRWSHVRRPFLSLEVLKLFLAILQQLVRAHACEAS